MKAFFQVIKSKVETGQYKLETMLSDIQLAYEKDKITLEEHEMLIELAKSKVDLNYVGNKYPTQYDLEQDTLINEHDLSVVDLYEMVLLSATAMQKSKMAVSSSISDAYVRLILKGQKTLEDVHETMKEEVSKKLLNIGFLQA